MTPDQLKTVFSTAKAAGINCTIGGSLLHVEGNTFELPIDTVFIDTVGKGKLKVAYLSTILKDGQSCSLKQLCQVKGLDLVGSFQQRAESLLSKSGKFTVETVKESTLKGRDGKSYVTYDVTVKALEQAPR